MARFLMLLAIVGLAVWWLFGRAGRSALKGGERGPARQGDAAQEMVACAHCGVHLPRAEAQADGELLYCGEEHRRLGPRRP